MISYLEDRLYSKAFEAGFDYAVEKLFVEEDEEKKPKKWPYVIGGAVAGTIGGAATTGAVKYHLLRKDIPEEVKKNFDRLTPEQFNSFLKFYREHCPSGYRKIARPAVGAGLGATAALGVAAPMALYHYRKNKLNKKERD